MRRNPAAIVAAGARGRLGKVRRPVPFVAPLPGSVRVLGRLGFRAALAAASRRVFAGGRGWSPKAKFEIFRWSLFHDLSEPHFRLRSSTQMFL